MPTDPVTVATIAEALGGDLFGDGSTAISDVVHDSRDAGAGCLFAAIRGFRVDGHTFVSTARRRGASAALVEDHVDVDIPQIRVDDTRRALAFAAAAVHHHPSRSMTVIGITGTNGKTTVTYALEAIARAAGRSFGRIGTLGATINGQPAPVRRTTPEASDLQRLLRQMADEGVELVAMEVSSHALVLCRAEAVSFSVAAFTNLSQDHLDFHADMSEYFEAKQLLFDGRATHHVLWIDDEAGARLAERLDEALTVGFGTNAFVRATDVVAGLTTSQITLHIDDRSTPATVTPGGTHNIANALVAAACAHVVGIDIEAIREGLASMPRIPGRLDPVEAGQPFTVVVDYAHSPAGVETVIRGARELTAGSVIVVVGSAGDRDAAKRPLMGSAAALADVAVITSDNPRTEDPQALVEAVVAGTVGGRAEVVAEINRTRAIHLALDRAQPGDAVLILGKGHEQGQDFGEEVIAYDDRQVAMAHLADRWAS